MEDFEIEAAELGGRMGGEYLDLEVKVYDLRLLTRDQWRNFCACICKEFMLKRYELEQELLKQR